MPLCNGRGPDIGSTNLKDRFGLKRTLGVTDPRSTDQKLIADVLGLPGVRPLRPNKRRIRTPSELPLWGGSQAAGPRSAGRVLCLVASSARSCGMQQGCTLVKRILRCQRCLSAFPVPLPPTAEQKEIVAEIDRRLSLADEAEAQVNANLQRAERLRHAILARAFTSEQTGAN